MNKLQTFLKNCALTIAYPFFKLEDYFRKKKPILDTIDLSKSKILILSLAGIGDAIMAEPLVRAIAQKWPTVKIDLLVVKERFAGEIFQAHPAINSVIEYKKTYNPFAMRKFFLQYKGLYTAVFATYPSGIVQDLICCYIDAQISIGHTYNIGFVKKKTSFHYTHVVPFEEKHQIDLNLELYESVTGEKAQGTPKVFVKAMHKTYAEQFMKENNVDKPIGFHPGTSNYFNTYSMKEYATLARYLASMGDLVVFAGPGETGFVQNVMNLAGVKHTMVKKETLPKTVALLSQCTFVVSNDSGIAHISAGLGVKTFALFGGTNFNLTGPKGKDVYLVYHEPYTLAYNIKTGYDKNHKITDLTAKEIVSKIKVVNES